MGCPFKDIFHGRIIDATSLYNNHLLRTTWRVSDVALSGILLRCGALSSEAAQATTVEAGVTEGGSSGRWRRQA
jgi:hypothetical protein